MFFFFYLFFFFTSNLVRIPKKLNIHKYSSDTCQDILDLKLKKKNLNL